MKWYSAVSFSQADQNVFKHKKKLLNSRMKFALFSGKYTIPALAQVPGGCEGCGAQNALSTWGEWWRERGPALGVCVLRANVHSSQTPCQTCVPCSQRRKLREAQRGDISEIKEPEFKSPLPTWLKCASVLWGGGGGGQGGESFFSC